MADIESIFMKMMLAQYGTHITDSMKKMDELFSCW